MTAGEARHGERDQQPEINNVDRRRPPDRAKSSRSETTSPPPDQLHLFSLALNEGGGPRRRRRGAPPFCCFRPDCVWVILQKRRLNYLCCQCCPLLSHFVFRVARGILAIPCEMMSSESHTWSTGRTRALARAAVSAVRPENATEII